MEADRTADPGRCGDRAQARAAAHGAQRRAVGAAQRVAVARSAGALRAVAVDLPSFQLLAPHQGVRGDARGPADAARRARPHRLGSLVRGWFDRPRLTSRCRGREKRGAEEPRDHALGRSRGGFSSKLHLVADGHGLPLAIHVTAGQVPESTQFEEVMNRVRIRQPIGPPRTRPDAMAGDKGYSYPRIRSWL